METLKRMPFEKSDFIFEKLGKIAEVCRLSKEEHKRETPFKEVCFFL